MPFWAEKIGIPRALAVAFPFGHILGQPHNPEQQFRVIRQALEVLERAQVPGTIHHSQERYPATHEAALRASHPETPPPITTEMGRHIGKFLRGLRRSSRKPTGKPRHSPTQRAKTQERLR